MHHKRGRPKNRRAGCLMCKPHKANGCHTDKVMHHGFGKLRKLISAKQDQCEVENYVITKE